MLTNESGYGTLLVSSYGSVAGTRYPGQMIRQFENNVWNPWEWVNPPMLLGVEYRTTERYLDKPVYCKTFDFGSLPNATQKVVTYGDDTTQTIRATAVTKAGAIVTGGTGHVSSFSNFLILSTNNNTVGISSAEDASRISAFVTVWYTKSTD